MLGLELRTSGIANYRLCLSFFFFQAEDGIRDLTVTGVQTCALPIYGDTPLLETGEMRDSIHHHVDPHEPAGYVGTNNKIAVYQELGTDRIPPRSFLAGAATHKEHEIHELAARVMAGVMMRNGQYYREFKIILEELHKAAHRIKEFGEEFIGDEDENKRR